MATKSKAQQALDLQTKFEQIDQLKSVYGIRPKCNGKADAYSTIYTRLNHVSRSGMYRVVSVFVIHHNQPLNITRAVAKAIGNKIDERHNGIAMGGCGYDVGYQIVYALGCALWPKGTKRPHSTRNGEPDTDGGYALRHEWF